MNKRLKLKRGILHKKCDESCAIYRIIIKNKFITNNSCIGCRLREKTDFICDENFQLIEKTRGIKVFQMNEYEWWVIRGYAEELNDWYNSHIADNDIEDVRLCDLDKEGMWYQTNDKKDIEELGDSDELYVLSGHTSFGDLMRKDGEIYKYISFREAVAKDLNFKEPYCIASTEY